MLTKSRVGNILEILAVGSLTAIGFSVGNPILTEAIKGIGLNLASNLLQKGATVIRVNWFSSNNGILNHDIQKAFVRALIEASNLLEKEYFQKYENLETQERKDVKELFSELCNRAYEVFIESENSAISDEDLKICFYADEKNRQEIIWNRLERFFPFYTPTLKEFLKENLLKTIVFCFAEELKKDTEEGKRAWAAFQRLLLESIRADIEKLDANQNLIREDLRKLDLIRNEIYDANLFIRREILESLGGDVRFIRENVEEIHVKVDKIHSLVEKIRPIAEFDENIFRREYNEILHRVMFARSPYELNSVRHQIEYLEKKYPEQKDVYFLRDKFNRAENYEKSVTPTGYHPNNEINVQSQPPGVFQQKKSGYLKAYLLVYGVTFVPVFLLSLIVFSMIKFAPPTGNSGVIVLIIILIFTIFIAAILSLIIWGLYFLIKNFRSK